MLNAIAYAKGMVAGHQLILHMLLHTRVTFDAALTVRPVLKTDTHSYTHTHIHTQEVDIMLQQLYHTAQQVRVVNDHR